MKDHYESPCSLLLEEAHHITYHQQCINSLVIAVNKYLNGHSSDTISDVVKLRENICNLQNFHIFQTKKPLSLKYRLDAIPYDANQL